MWELCNEENDPGVDPRLVRAWHADMAACLHEIEPNRHLVSTRFGSSKMLEQLMVVGLKGRRTALVWFYDQHSSWRQRAIGKPVRTFESVCAYLPADTAGQYRVQWWDTWRGGIISQSDRTPRDGRLRLAPPRFERDIACKVQWLD